MCERHRAEEQSVAALHGRSYHVTCAQESDQPLNISKPLHAVDSMSR